MSNLHLRFRPLLVAAALALMLPIGADAAASTNTAVTSQSGDGATLTLSAKAKRSFSGQHVSLTAQRPATRRKSTYALPDSSGKWNFAKATGTLNLKGVLHVVLGKRSVAMKSVTFTRPAKGNGQVSVKLAGHKVQLFTVTGKVKVKHSGATEILSGMTAKLTKAGATKLDKALSKSALSNGQSIGSFTVRVSTAPITGTSPGAPGATGVTPSSSSGVGLALTPDFVSLLNSAGLSGLPLVPASGGLPAPLGTTTIPGADGSSVTLPLNGSTRRRQLRPGHAHGHDSAERRIATRQRRRVGVADQPAAHARHRNRGLSAQLRTERRSRGQADGRRHVPA